METLIFKASDNATIAIDDLPFDDGLKKRQRENVGAKILFEKLLNRKVEIIHNAEGKPFLQDNSLKISISHSKTKITVIVHSDKNVGIDIEEISPKILHLAKRFLSKKELEKITQSAENYTLAWAAKETAFKIIGKTATNFRTNLEIRKIEQNDSGGIIYLKILNENISLKLSYKIFADSVLVWGNE